MTLFYIMPSQTFIRLSDQKKQELLHACLVEFALNDYKNASVTTIVKKTGIAKGSIYQYFKNKKDLYFYLIDEVLQMKYKKLSPMLEKMSEQFLNYYQDFFMAELQFYFQYPLHASFLHNFYHERNTEELGNLLLEKKREEIIRITRTIEQEKSKLKIRQSVKSETLAFVFMQIQIGLGDYISIKYGKDIRENILNGTPAFEKFPESEIKKSLVGISFILRNGIMDM